MIARSVFVLCAWTALASAATSVVELGLKGDGQTDNTVALQQALAAGKLELDFPPGTYRLGTVELPQNTRLRFSPQARVTVEPAKVREMEGETAKDSVRPLFVLKGDRIVVDGLDAAGLFEVEGKDQRGRARPALNCLVFGEGVADVTFRNLRVMVTEKKRKAAPTMLHLQQCRDIVLADSQLENILYGLKAERCQNVSVHGNRAINCNTITTFTHSEGLRHYDNWSRQVIYQCVFRGGSPDPSRKAPRVPLGSSNKVIRSLDPKQPDYNSHLAGTYDIQISNNYAEYGRTLAWGNKGRQVIFSGNVSRFMNDYSYGVEGCENVVFANNISINAKSVGIMTMYWGEKVVITGNQIIVRDEPYVQAYSDFPEQKAYWGGLLRFHHGPTTKEDAAAGSRYGAGKVIVSGNLLVNELHDQMRGIGIESGRDILISGNRIVNGCVRKSGEGDVSILGNEFASDMPAPPGIVTLGTGTGQAIVKDNVMRFAAGKSPVIATNAAPAIANATGAKTMSLLLVEGNVIQGWTNDAIALTAVPRDTDPIRFIVRGNSLDGTIRIAGLPQSYRSLVTNNINIQTLAPVQPVLATQEPASK